MMVSMEKCVGFFFYNCFSSIILSEGRWIVHIFHNYFDVVNYMCFGHAAASGAVATGVATELYLAYGAVCKHDESIRYFFRRVPFQWVDWEALGFFQAPRIIEKQPFHFPVAALSLLIRSQPDIRGLGANGPHKSYSTPATSRPASQEASRVNRDLV